jgi:DNA-binding PadR family transcriptional regulator
LDFLLLKQIQDTPEGVSGYELQKMINSLFVNQLDGNIAIRYNKLSQTRVYRILDEYKSKGYVIVKLNVIVNKRLQNLFQISEMGKNYYNEISKMIKYFFPHEISIESVIGDLLSGKISPLEVLFENAPKEDLLIQLKEFRKFLLKELKRIESKISELESNEVIIKK